MLFGKIWMKENGFTAEPGTGMVKVFGGSFLLMLIMSYNLAAFLSGPPNLQWGIIAGALAGIGWVATAYGVTYLFERKSMKLFLINAGYHVLNFIIMGAILGSWK